jgi:hypothetical protein
MAGATDCYSNGACAPFGGGAVHVYPYPGASSLEEGYRQNVVADLENATTLGFNRPLASLHVVHLGSLTVDDEVACGRAYIGDGNPLSGRSVSSSGSAACPVDWKSAVHELGHQYGADHEVYPATAPFTFMKQGNPGSLLGFAKYFSPTNGTAVNLCLGEPTCPRSADLGN